MFLFFRDLRRLAALTRLPALPLAINEQTCYVPATVLIQFVGAGGTVPGLNCGAGEERGGVERGGAEREDSRDREAADLQQSRSDKWKAKHEAMLKLAASPLSLNDNTKSGKNEPSNAEEEMKIKQQIFENKNLVITVNETAKENNEALAYLEPSVETDIHSEECGGGRSKTRGGAGGVERGGRAGRGERPGEREPPRLTTRSMKTVLAV